MNRKSLLLLLLCLAVASPALAIDSMDPPTPWWFRGLTFHAPFDDPASPLKLIRGTGALTFTNATDNVLPITDNGAYLTAGDTLLMPIAGNIDWAEGTISATVKRSSTSGTDTIFRRDGIGVYFIFYFNAGELHFYYGELSNHLAVSSNDTNIHKVAISWKHGGAYAICIDGGTPVSGVHAGTAFSTTYLDVLIGSNPGEELDGNVKDLRIEGRAFNASELQAITR